MLIAHVALPMPVYRLFDYIVDEKLLVAIDPISDKKQNGERHHHPFDIKNIQVGLRVKVPFGNRQHAIGIIAKLDNKSDIAVEKLKPITAILDQTPLFTPSIWQLINWAADYYHYPFGEIVFHAIPVLLRQGKQATFESIKRWQPTELGRTIDVTTLSRTPKQKQLLQLLRNNCDIPGTFSSSIYRELEKKSLIEQVNCETIPCNWQSHFSINSTNLQLNTQQTQAVTAINQQRDQFAIFLVDGVTGSGKTEVYLTALNAILERGEQALVMVPEISLTPQTIARFKQRFNAPIDLLHSGLTEKERLAVWLRSKNGDNAIVIGTRSSLFTPFKKLGMIIIDEEHDSSYKQQEGFRYHARDLAIIRAKFENIPIVLGSATPSLETLNNVQNGKYQHLLLTERAGNATFAKQSIIDLRGLVLSAGLSIPLIEKIRDHLAKNNQVMLFLNRRGFAPILLCHDCGWIAECPRCDRPYTYHQNQHKLNCHYCDTPRTLPKQCPKCGSTHLQPIGFGTEQLENQLTLLFPNIPISRIDRDTVSKKGALDIYLAKVNQGGAHILVGTQILAKGHHFPDVTLACIIDIDGALFSTDFRATERFAQIYTQVSGRAGRENKAGEVILQTYHPTHPLLTNLLQNGYQAFAQETLKERKETALPPFSHQVLIQAADRNNQHAPHFLQKVYEYLKQNSDENLWLLGPIPANQPKKAGYYRWQLLLQHSSRQTLQQIVTQLLLIVNQWETIKNVRWRIDVDPIEN